MLTRRTSVPRPQPRKRPRSAPSPTNSFSSWVYPKTPGCPYFLVKVTNFDEATGDVEFHYYNNSHAKAKYKPVWLKETKNGNIEKQQPLQPNGFQAHLQYAPLDDFIRTPIDARPNADTSVRITTTEIKRALALWSAPMVAAGTVVAAAVSARRTSGRSARGVHAAAVVLMTLLAPSHSLPTTPVQPDEYAELSTAELGDQGWHMDSTHDPNAYPDPDDEPYGDPNPSIRQRRTLDQRQPLEAVAFPDNVAQRQPLGTEAFTYNTSISGDSMLEYIARLRHPYCVWTYNRLPMGLGTSPAQALADYRRTGEWTNHDIPAPSEQRAFMCPTRFEHVDLRVYNNFLTNGEFIDDQPTSAGNRITVNTTLIGAIMIAGILWEVSRSAMRGIVRAVAQVVISITGTNDDEPRCLYPGCGERRSPGFGYCSHGHGLMHARLVLGEPEAPPEAPQPIALADRAPWQTANFPPPPPPLIGYRHPEGYVPPPPPPPALVPQHIRDSVLPDPDDSVLPDPDSTAESSDDSNMGRPYESPDSGYNSEDYATDFPLTGAVTGPLFDRNYRGFDEDQVHIAPADIATEYLGMPLQQPEGTDSGLMTYQQAIAQHRQQLQVAMEAAVAESGFHLETDGEDDEHDEAGAGAGAGEPRNGYPDSTPEELLQRHLHLRRRLMSLALDSSFREPSQSQYGTAPVTRSQRQANRGPAAVLTPAPAPAPPAPAVVEDLRPHDLGDYDLEDGGTDAGPDPGEEFTS